VFKKLFIAVIIMIGKTALFEPQSSSDDSAKLQPVFTYLDFATIFFTEQGCQPCVQLPNLESESYVTTDGQPASLSGNEAPI
jgi:hypothetical protein